MLAPSEAARRVDGAVGAGQDGARVFQELGAGLGQFDAARQAQEQRRADLALQLLDLLAQRRLADTEPRGGAGEVQLVGDHGEIAQVSQFHRY